MHKYSNKLNRQILWGCIHVCLEKMFEVDCGESGKSLNFNKSTLTNKSFSS